MSILDIVKNVAQKAATGKSESKETKVKHSSAAKPKRAEVSIFKNEIIKHSSPAKPKRSAVSIFKNRATNLGSRISDNSVFNVFKNGAQKADTEKTESREIKVKQSSTAEPKNAVLNLDEYFGKGYNKDEQDKKAADVLREDVLSRYDIDENDANKTKKLAKIYLDILDNANNKYLLENYEKRKKEYEELTDEDFLKNVELTLAHMMHDKTSKGDKVSLDEVDFSDIDKTNTYKKGNMEAKVVDNGVEYTVYDNNGEVLKFISKTTDSNGMTTIATYSDPEKNNLISKDIAYEFPKTDDEVKYKFGSENENTIDFKDNGDTVSAVITKGVLKEKCTIEKNDDGTYVFEGKQYYTIEELASDMNKKELKASKELDGIVSASQQGSANDCAVISAINSLSMTELGREALKNAVSADSDGNITVNFVGIERGYTVTKEEYEARTELSTGDKEIRAIEIALEKMFDEVKSGIIKPSRENFYYEDAKALKQKEEQGQSLITGTFATLVYELLTGKHKYFTGSFVEQDFLEQLDTMETQANRAMTVGISPNDVSPQQSRSQKTYKVCDAYGNEVEIYNLHAYTVKESDTKADDTRIITLIDPYDSSKEIVLSEETFLKFYNKAYDVNLSNEFYESPYITV